MSIFLKICAALSGAAVLAGCVPTESGSLSFLEPATSARGAAPTSARLAGGKIVISGPQGYCVDPSTLRRTADGGFVTLVSCHILSDGQSGPIVEPALLTVTVGPASNGAPSLDDLAAALETRLVQNRELSAVTAGLFATGGARAFDGSDPRHWRGAFVIGDSLVGLALYAPTGSPLVGMQGAAFLNTVSSRIRANSSDQAPIAQQSQASVDTLDARLESLFARRDL